MKVPYSWLADYVDLDELTPQAVADGLTNAGLEVEEIEQTGAVFTNVIVAKVDAVEPHPNADKLRLVTVNKGARGVQKVVCGAPNVREGIRIAFAEDGARVLNRKTGETFVLGTATIRGIESTGMVCSIDELGLNERYEAAEDGIWVLDTLTTEAQVGEALETVLGLAQEHILHVAPTANRGDWMSIIGVAREVAAVFGKTVTLPDNRNALAVSNTGSATIDVQLPDLDVCRYYAMGELTDVKIAESPDWLKARLTAMGTRCINNVVDITNYVMFATGQPLHAFDRGQLGAAGIISARRATAGETLLTLDDETLELNETNVLIDFNNTPVALAGVMGGLESGITDSTTDVVLEVAYFPSATTRKSARAANGLRSESSARFERGVDPRGQEAAFSMAASLMQELAGAKLKAIVVADSREAASQTITLDLKRIPQVLGIDIPTDRVIEALSALGFDVANTGAQSLSVGVPSNRFDDVKKDVDLIEEIIRIYGYDHLPLTLPMVDVTPVRSFRQRFLELVRKEIQALGLSEAMTLSLIAEAKTPQAVTLSNSHSREHTVLRETLLDGLQDVIFDNVAKGNTGVWLYEIGRRYNKSENISSDLKSTSVSETLCLAGALYGHVSLNSSHSHPHAAGFYALKGTLDALFASLGLSDKIRYMSYSDDNRFHPGRCAELKLGKTPLGIAGQLHPLLAEDAKLKHSLLLFELNLEPLLDAAQKAGLFTQTVQAISAFPYVERDIAFKAPVDLSHQKIVSAIKQLNQPLIQDIQLFDVYQGEQIEAGHRSMAYRLVLGSLDKTLTDAEIDAVVGQVRETLEKQLTVELR